MAENLHVMDCPACGGTGFIQNLLDEYERCNDCIDGKVRVRHG